MEKYLFLKEIGSGSFGKVFLVKSKQEGINYVVKKVNLSKLDRKQSLSATAEVELLAKLRHNNIVSYKESYEKNNELNIVLEYCENGDLHNKIKEKRIDNKCFAENEIFDYFVQISLALEYIHSHKILHRDLKTKNIFLTKGNIIKLGDFGIAKTLENSFELAETCIGSPFYLSPEICESKPYNKKSDVWALGCVLYELTTLRHAFVARNVKTLVTKILSGAYNPLPTNTNLHIRNLISSMLKPNPADRPSVREILGKQFLIQKRATFICKAYRNDFCKRRSKSGGDRNFPSEVIKNEIKKNNLNSKRMFSSCMQLNELKIRRKFNNISNPRAKYDPSNNCQDLKNDKKSVLTTCANNENGKITFSPKNQEESNSETKKFYENDKNCKIQLKYNCQNKNSYFENLKNMKLPKVNSEYYDLIAGHDGKEDNSKEKENSTDKKIKDGETDWIKINAKLGTQKIQGILEPMSKVAEAVEESGDLLPSHLEKETVQTEENLNSGALDSGREHRKRWSQNTLQREALLAIFSRSELLESSLIHKTSHQKSAQQSIDDMLSVNPSEIDQDVLQPVKLHEKEPEKKDFSSDYLQFLRHEVRHLKEKFQLNGGNYLMEDLMRLTDNSKNILTQEGFQKHSTECDKKVGESVYYDLECLRVKLEQKIGLCAFLQVYGKMVNLINDELHCALENSLDKQFDPTKTYVIKKVHVAVANPRFVRARVGRSDKMNFEVTPAERQSGMQKRESVGKYRKDSGDNDDLIKSTWKSIIGILDNKREYLPDVWELAMSENICYRV